MPSLIFYTSAISDLASADAAATSAGGMLVIDSNLPPISSNTTLSSKQISASGGIVTLGNADLTMNGTFLNVGPVQLFSYTGTGRLLGNTDSPEVYPEWFGNSPSNIQYAVDYVMQSDVQTRKIRLTKPAYTITAPVVITGNQHPNIEGTGLYGTVLNFATDTEQAAIIVTGTEQFSGGSLRGLTITDPRPAGPTGLICLQLSGPIGFCSDLAFAKAKRGIVEYNSSDQTFTEFNRHLIQSDVNTETALEFRANPSSVNISHHGAKLLPGTVINSYAGNYAVIIGDGCTWYDGRIDVSWFCHDNPDGTTEGIFIKNFSSNAVSWFYGTIGVEAFNSGRANLASGPNIYLLGEVSFWGDQSQFYFDSLVLAESIAYGISGAPVLSLKPRNEQQSTTSQSVTVLYPSTLQQYLVSTDITGTGYHFIQYFILTTDGTSGIYTGSPLFGSPVIDVNTAGYSAPSLNWGGNSLTASSPSWGSNKIVLSATFNQIGQDFAHHDH